MISKPNPKNIFLVLKTQILSLPAILLTGYILIVNKAYIPWSPVPYILLILLVASYFLLLKCLCENLRDDSIVGVCVVFFAYTLVFLATCSTATFASGASFSVSTLNGVEHSPYTGIRFPALDIFEYYYWTSTTFTTLGYGEITPYNKIAKILSSIYSILGITHATCFLAILLRAQGLKSNERPKAEVLVINSI